MNEGARVLIEALCATYSPDAGQRERAEAALKAMESAPGYVPALLQVAVAGEADRGVRLAAAIALKNAVRRSWAVPEGVSAGAGAAPVTVVSEADKAAVRAGVLDAMCAAEPLVRKQLAVAVQRIALWDFPGAWPDLVPRVLALLGAQRMDAVQAALLALRHVLRNFARVGTHDPLAKHLARAVAAVFPVLERMLPVLAATPPSRDTLVVEALVAKIFRTCTSTCLPAHFHAAPVVEAWMTFFGTLLQRPLLIVQYQQQQQQQQGQQEQQQNAMAAIGAAAARAKAEDAGLYWKAPRRAVLAAIAWLVRYGGARRTKSARLNAALAPFRTRYACALAQAMMQLLAHCDALRMPGTLVYSCMTYLGNAARFEKIFRPLEPHVLDLLTRVAFPMCCASAQTLQLATTDPVEFLQCELCGGDSSGDDDGDDDDGGDGGGTGSGLYTRRQGARNLIVDFCHFRADAYLMPLMQFVVRVLNETRGSAADAAVSRKYGALTVIAALDVTLRERAVFAAQLEPMLAAHVLPELGSSHPLLRAQACWTFARYCGIEWRDSALFTRACEAVLALTGDANLIVSVFATRSLQCVVATDLGREILRPVLGQVLDVFYRLIDRTDIDLDDLVDALNTVTGAYGAAVAPHAAGMCAHLAAAFGGVLATISDDTDPSDAAVSKANTCLVTLESLLVSVLGTPALAAQLVDALVPLVAHVLAAPGDRYADFYTETLCLLRVMTQAVLEPTPALWSLFAPVCRCCDANPDFMPDVVAPLHYYISRDPATFLADPAALAAVRALVARHLADPAADEVEASRACLLAAAPILFCPGAVDPYVADAVVLAAQRLAAPQHPVESRVLRVLLLDIVLAGLYTRPALALAALAAHPPALATALAALHAARPLFTRAEDQTAALLALAALFRLPPASLPPLVQQHAPTLLVDALAFMRRHQHGAFLDARAAALDALQSDAATRGVPWRSLAPPDLLAPDPYADPAWQSDSDEPEIAHAVSSFNEDIDELNTEYCGVGDDDDDDGDGDDGGDGGAGDDDDEIDDDHMNKLAESEVAEFGLDDYDDFDEFTEIDEEGLLSPFVGVDHVAFFGGAMKHLATLAATTPALAAVLSSLAPKYQHQMQHWIALADAAGSSSQSQ